MATEFTLQKEKVGFIFFFSVPKSHTQQIWWERGIDVLDQNISS